MKNPPVMSLADFSLITILLLFPKLIICRLDLRHFACGDKYRSFTDICDPVGDPLEIMSHPQEPVGALDGFWILDDEGHQLAVDLVVKRVHFIILNRKRLRSCHILVDKGD